jgi:hypothetical protein
LARIESFLKKTVIPRWEIWWIKENTMQYIYAVLDLQTCHKHQFFQEYHNAASYQDKQMKWLNDQPGIVQIALDEDVSPDNPLPIMEDHKGTPFQGADRVRRAMAYTRYHVTFYHVYRIPLHDHWDREV